MPSQPLRRLSSLILASAIAASVALGAGVPAVEAAGQPDLQVSQWGSTSASAGQPFSFKVKLTNTGTADTPNGQKVAFIGALQHGFKITGIQSGHKSFKCEFDNEVQIAIEPEWPLFACGSERPLAAGDSATVLVNAIASASPGRYRIDVQADPQNWIAESNEGNNALQTPFQVN